MSGSSGFRSLDLSHAYINTHFLVPFGQLNPITSCSNLPLTHSTTRTMLTLPLLSLLSLSLLSSSSPLPQPPHSKRYLPQGTISLPPSNSSLLPGQPFAFTYSTHWPPLGFLSNQSDRDAAFKSAVRLPTIRKGGSVAPSSSSPYAFHSAPPDPYHVGTTHKVSVCRRGSRSHPATDHLVLRSFSILCLIPQ